MKKLILLLMLFSIIAQAQGPLLTRVRATAFFEGYFDDSTGLMKSNFRHIPKSCNDTMALGKLYAHYGIVRLPDTISNAVDSNRAVGWVMIVMKTLDTAIVRAGMLMTDGTVINALNGGLPAFPQLYEPAYYYVRHPNHLPLCGAYPYNPSPYVDLPLDRPSVVFEGSKALKKTKLGNYIAPAGDCNVDFWDDLDDLILIINSQGQSGKFTNVFEIPLNMTNKTDWTRQMENWFMFFHTPYPEGKVDNFDNLPKADIPYKLVAKNFIFDLPTNIIQFDVYMEGISILGAIEGTFKYNPDYMSIKAAMIADSILDYAGIHYSPGQLEFFMFEPKSQEENRITKEGTKICQIGVTLNRLEFGSELKPEWGDTRVAVFDQPGHIVEITNQSYHFIFE